VRDAALDWLVEQGALDVERSPDGAVAALMPDSVDPAAVAAACGVQEISVSPAAGRDADSVWVLGPRAIRVGRIRIAPAHLDADPGTLRLIDSAAFGTGLHPTTALCLEAIDHALQAAIPDSVLDVGTGSGVLALAALGRGAPRAVGIDIDPAALTAAADNARLNGLRGRLMLARAGPDALSGRWPLVLANVLAAPLVEMAPALARCVGHQARLVLSGIPRAVEPDVHQTYRRLGMRTVDVTSRGGWTALVLQASW